MTDTDRLAKEIYERSIERYRKRKAERLAASLPPTPQQRAAEAEERLSTDKRSDKAVLDHLAREAAEAKRRLETDERAERRRLQEKINNHPDVIKLRLQRMGIVGDPIAQAQDRYYRACADIVDANAEIAKHAYVGCHRGPGDSDWGM
jgi:hypothetical protein